MTWVDIVIPLISSIIGGLLTLGGVAWTIKVNNKDRKSDLERIETDRKEEERKKLIPYVCLNHLGKISGSINTSVRHSFDFNQKDDLKKLSNNRFYCYTINNFLLKNVSKNCIIFESIILNDKEYVFEGDKLVESGQVILVKTTENYQINSETLLNSIQLKCKDLIGNSYSLDCKYKYNFSHDFPYFETEIDGIIYKGFNAEYTIDNIDLPVLVKEKSSNAITT